MKINELPMILKPILEMNNPNEDITFHKDNFKMIWENEEYQLKGKLILKWFPKIHVVFSGVFSEDSKEFNFNLKSSIAAEIKSCTSDFKAKVAFKKICNKEKKIDCFLPSPINVGNINDLVDFVQFELTNQEQRKSSVIRTNNTSASFKGLELLDGNFKIIIDEYSDSLEKRAELKNAGGFHFLSSCKIESINNSQFKFEKLSPTIEKLSQFLLFLNARKTTPMIIYGYRNGEVIWKHFQTLECDKHNFYNGWVLKNIELPLNRIWIEFINLWENDKDKDSLKMVLNWYNEANKDNILPESGIVLIQNALELLFNWLIVEKFGNLSLDDAKNLSAAGKIRILLLKYNLDDSTPSGLKKLSGYSKEYNIKGPEIFTNIRNIIVHSNSKKLKKIQDLKGNAKNEVLKEALNLGIWYVEVILLKFLNFEGEYNNRCYGPHIINRKDKL